MTKRRELEPHEKADAERLLAEWEKYQAAHPEATQEWLARMCGWKTQGAAYQYLNGLVPLNLAAALKLAKVMGVPVAAFSPRLAAQLPRDVALRVAENTAEYGDKVFVSRVSGAKLSAGAGEVLWDWEEIDNSHAFRHEWMAEQNLRADRCKLYDVRGDSMSPTINTGDTVLINMADREIIPGEVYALVGDDGLRVKRLQKRGGIFYMHSDNQLQPGRFPDEPISEGNYAVIGRVVWKAGRV